MGLLLVGYGVSNEDISRTRHAHPMFAVVFKELVMATHGKGICFLRGCILEWDRRGGL